MTPHQRKISAIFSNLLDWFSQNARDLPWRRTRDPYAIWVSEIMLQQTQVKTVLPFWERWMRELPTIEAVAKASPDKIHKLWEGLGYYTRVRNLQKAAKQIVSECREKAAEDCRTPKRKREGEDDLRVRPTGKKGHCQFPQTFEEVLALPGIGRYTAGAICSIAFNQPTPILDGNVMRVLTRIFGIEKDPREKETNQLLWQLAEELVVLAAKLKPFHGDPYSHEPEPSPHPDPLPSHRNGSGEGKAIAHKRYIGRQTADTGSGVQSANFPENSRPNYFTNGNCSHLNQSLMELGALVCTPRNPQCGVCPVKKLCAAFKENRTDELPNLGKREAATTRRFVAFVIEHRRKFLVRQRPENVVNAHLWEFPNVELNGHTATPSEIFKSQFGFLPTELLPLPVVKHSITRYRITLEAFRATVKKAPKAPGTWLAESQLDSLAFASAHRKILSRLQKKLTCLH